MARKTKATHKSSSKAVHPPKPKKAPAGMTGAQKDAVQDITDRKLTSVPQQLKDGKIDHGDIADPSPHKGVLDPEAFDKFSHEFRQTGSETQRMDTVICEHLNEHYSSGGKYQWTTGFFLETDPRAAGADHWQPLTEEMIGPAWSSQLRHELGLTVYNGALCWNGRGTLERHIICVKTKQLQERQLQEIAEASKQMVSRPVEVGGKEVGRMEIDEKVTRERLVSVRDGESMEGASDMD